MKTPLLNLIRCGALFAACAFTPSPANAEEERSERSKTAAPDKPVPAVAIQQPVPKPLTGNVRKGLAYLVETQHKSGGWGQGGGWRVGTKGQGRVEGDEVADPPDIGNTSIALVAFLRAGKSFEDGQYGESMTKAANFLLGEVGKNQDDTLYVTSVRDTQLQSKIGTYVDTFLAALVLSELKGKVPQLEMEQHRESLLARVVKKIEKHQKADGTFEDNRGWAAVLSQGICSTALNRAWLAGGGVSDRALRQDAFSNGVGVVAGQSTITAKAGAPTSAGVDIYRYGSQLGGLQAQARSNFAFRRKQISDLANSPEATEEQKKAAQTELAAIEKNDADAEVALNAVQAQIKKADFVKGFGNNGGEEFLSYMNISEAMCAKGGKEWADWDARMTKTINGTQNEDGSWAGQHCITGRTFCTATALLTLMADRAPIPEPDPEAREDAPAKSTKQQTKAERSAEAPSKP